MKHVFTVLIIMLALLSVAAGAAKVMLVPEEATFLRQFGFTDTLMMLFGAGQILAGALLVIAGLRLYGALLAALCFAVSSGLLLFSGDVPFALVSLVPVILAGLIARRSIAAD